MKATPILMQSDMVRATLREIGHPGSGKTQTRRLRGLEEINGPTSKWEFAYCGRHKGEYGAVFKSGEFYIFVACPYGGPRDLLWVRETIRKTLHGPDPVYRADIPDDVAPGFAWTPSIHMPRWASRITLPLINVRVERLQDISQADAISEGIECIGGQTSCSPWRDYSKEQRFKFFSAPSASYRSLWGSINGPGSWDKNPWVWVLVFIPHMINIDQLLKPQKVVA